MIPVRLLCPGVRPVEGEPLVYLVQSATRKEIWHRVDFAAWNGYGECGCESFQIKKAPLLREGIFPNPALECLHIKRARRFLAIEFIQKVIALREERAHENQIKYHHKPSVFEDENVPY